MNVRTCAQPTNWRQPVITAADQTVEKELVPGAAGHEPAHKDTITMTEFGIHTADHHLDVLENPPGQTASGQQAEFQWPAFQAWITASNWNGGALPAFAGRYFQGGQPNQRTDSNGNAYQQPPFQWSHAEGSLAQVSAPALQRIAPLQSADMVRQAETGAVGLLYGYADASSFCARLAACITPGELGVSNAVVYVFLDVADGTSISPQYWAGWADTVYNYVVPGLAAPSQPFLPCLCCSFTEDTGTQQYSPGADVAACLSTTQLSAPRLNARCYGFWAKAASQANLSQAPDFTRFAAFSQPMTSAASEPVWVLIWRYAEQADPPDAAFAGGNRLSLEATNEATASALTLNRMLSVGSYSLTSTNTSYLGVDRAAPFASAEAACLGAQLNVPATRGQGGASPVQFSGNLAFAVRYYATPSLSKVLKPAEIALLQSAGLRVAVVWQILGSLAEWAAPGAGVNHGLAAFSYADAMQQAPHTPVYFSLDVDPSDPVAYPTAALIQQNRQTIETYFAGVLTGYQQYQQQQRNNGVDPVPFEIGVYGAGVLLRYCYEQGIASYFWETNAVAWTESRPIWPHANLIQVTFPVPYAPCSLQAGPPDTRVDFDASWGDEGAW
jgi:hypothetical protein